jgi:hypothetical protein
MATLNRFPLLGLWAKEAARRLGYSKTEAESLGHAYAVLYAIRARGPKQPSGDRTAPRPSRPARRAGKREVLSFGGDQLDVSYDPEGRVRGRVGGAQPQTPESYRASVERKFPPGYYDRLEECFRKLFKAYAPRALDSRLIYDLYDQWKQECGAGRRVDLDKLLAWCHQRAKGRRFAEKG